MLAHRPNGKLKALATQVMPTEETLLPGVLGTRVPPQGTLETPPPLNIGQEALCAYAVSPFYPSAVLTCVSAASTSPLGILEG